MDKNSGTLPNDVTREPVLVAIFAALSVSLSSFAVPVAGEAAGGPSTLIIGFVLYIIPGTIVGYMMLEALRKTGAL